MWGEIPLDILLQIFSFLPPNSLARAFSVCKQWQFCSKLPPCPPRYSPWFIAMPSNHSNCKNSYLFDPQNKKWHPIPMDFSTQPLRLVSSLPNGLLLMKFSCSTSLRLVICNPFTQQLRLLPDLLISRSNPAIGIITNKNISSFYFCVVVAGGASGSSYEPTMEIYDSRGGTDSWQLIGPMPVEFAVRLTVWTPNESVHTHNGFLYWMTSARAYSILRLELSSWIWSEVKLPMANKLEWAGLFRRNNGKLGLVGGGIEIIGEVWELEKKEEDDYWCKIDKVPLDLEIRFRSRFNGGNLGNIVKCGGANEAVFLYRELGSGMIVWSENNGWSWIEGFDLGFNVPFFKTVMIHPSLYS